MEKLVMDKAAIDDALAQISQKIIRNNKDINSLGLVGIRTKGRYLAQLIAAQIKQHQGVDIPVGTIDTSLYRDDVNVTPNRPILCTTRVPFAVADKKVILVDDVLYTGRTIRAALDALMDLGRSRAVELAVLIDRGHRELPIKADYVGYEIPTTADETIKLIIDDDLKNYTVVMLDEAAAKKW